jgi:glutamyl-tRNA synthetase
LAFLGWNPGTEQELFSLEDLIAAFELSRVSKSGAKFSPDKASWFNQQYMQTKENAELTDLYLSILAKKGIDKNKDFVLKVVSLIKERAVFVKDFWELSSFFFETPLEFEAKAAKKNWKEDTSELMTLFIPVISNIEDFSSENIEKEIKEWITSKEIGFGKIMQPLRLSLVGKLAGPHLFDIIAMIGKQETISRIENAIGKL